MRIGVPKEIAPGERRVAATPQSVQRLIKLGFEVLIESGAGEAANCSDAAYAEAGAEITERAENVWSEADVILKVRPPESLAGRDEVDLLSEGKVLICFIWPARNEELLKRLAERRVTTLAMDSVPRITRAQKLDALSSMANIAGYRAVVEAAHAYPHFFAGQMTAAGRIDPAKVLVIGAGVAGLAAIGAAKSLGAIVRAFDTRPEVKDQVRSMGAEFLELEFEEEGGGAGGYAKVMSESFIEAEKALFAAQAMDVDIIITTALVPGTEAPLLITKGMVESMKEGSVIVDLAAEQGGNCALTEPDEVVVHHGVTIIGYTDLPSRMASQSSQLYSTNLAHFLDELGGAADFTIDTADEVTRGALVTHEGQITWPPPKPPPPEVSGVSDRPGAVKVAEEPPADAVAASKRRKGLAWIAVAGLALLGVGLGAPESFLSHFTVFVLACFVGWQVVWNVTPALHTPLMSVTNAISGIIIIGGMHHLSGGGWSVAATLGVIAVFVASINIAGGFLVTRRMLGMFHR